MAQNAAGFVSIADLGYAPVLITGRAIAAMSGGQVVYAGSQAAPVSSGANSFDPTTDIWFNAPASGTNYPVGVCVTKTAASGADVAVCLKGLVLMYADGAIVPGQYVGAVNGAHAVTAIGSQDNPVVALTRKIGRAFTSAGSEQYCLVGVDVL